MRIAVFSDIHGNMDAFQQVLMDMDKCRIDAMFCLGDNIGYGPEPEEVLLLLRQSTIPSVLGNHEMACLNPSMIDWFNPMAAESLKKTIQMLSSQSFDFLSGLKKSLMCHGCRFVHGFPPNSSTTYLFQVSKKDIYQYMSQMEERICFIGHTHELRIIDFDGKKCTPDLLKKGIFQLKRQNRYIINIGSVGQPRDGDNRAKYVIWDSVRDDLEVRFVRYDIEKVVNKIIAAGLPEVHANKLW
ncbi:MAG: metallophosphoesterase family protein [Desulfobacterales bacterium]